MYSCGLYVGFICLGGVVMEAPLAAAAAKCGDLTWNPTTSICKSGNSPAKTHSPKKCLFHLVSMFYGCKKNILPDICLVP
jgi:hypothetical protein